MTEEVLKHHADRIRSWTLLPSSGGAFELTVNGELLFSKKALGRHASVEEIMAIFDGAGDAAP